MEKPGKTTLYINPEIYHRAKIFAAVSKKTVTEVIEEALTRYLDREEPKERRPRARPK
jgi:predicted transcriptional regulator